MLELVGRGRCGIEACEFEYTLSLLVIDAMTTLAYIFVSMM
jgi:hypothetical protein